MRAFIVILAGMLMCASFSEALESLSVNTEGGFTKESGWDFCGSCKKHKSKKRRH